MLGTEFIKQIGDSVGVSSIPHSQIVSLWVLTELECCRQVVLGDFNVCNGIFLIGFLAYRQTWGCLRLTLGATHVAWHVLDLVFCLRQKDDDLKVEEFLLMLLLLTDGHLVRFRLLGAQLAVLLNRKVTQAVS